jgi:prophage regulatory protein
MVKTHPHVEQLKEALKRRRIGGGQPLSAIEVDDAMLTSDTVLSVAGMSSSSMYRQIAAGTFPKPIKIGPRCARWKASEIKAWLRSVAGQAA